MLRLLEKTIMNMENLEICFHGPYNLGKNEDECILLNTIGREKGVYLWTVRFENKYLTYYVGETGVSFAYRTMEHVKNTLQGQYSLFEPEEFALGKKILLWNGMWKKRRNDPSTMHEFLHKYPEFGPKYFDFLMLMRFFVAPVKSSQRLRQRMEAAIADSLYKQPGIVGAFQDKGIRYLPRRSDEPPVCLRIESPKQIMGLPKELLV